MRTLAVMCLVLMLIAAALFALIFGGWKAAVGGALVGMGAALASAWLLGAEPLDIEDRLS